MCHNVFADFKCTEQEAPTIESIKLSPITKKWVHIDDVSINTENMLTAWLNDQVFFSINIKNKHWYLCVVNADLRTIEILDSFGPRQDLSLVTATLVGLKIYLDISVQELGSQPNRWRDNKVTTWLVKNEVDMPMQEDDSSCGLFTLKFMECWTGFSLRPTFTQEDIINFRLKLAAILVHSPLNKVEESPGSGSNEEQ
ncbi:ubiquitin-like-specific protease 1A [Phragmites australis]|uniref:ubiquitin-like-specific protease 1A n=1 Tax=Phragmites australis TaxID=29695 RepID=UPI002D78850F|nr:ubiquitin-like-specific protease 1A [Phragmites australis]